SLLIIFGENPDLAGYSSLGLPETFNSLHQSQETAASLAQPDLNNPFFESIFDSSDERIEMPTAISTVTWRGGGTNILSYDNGKPFVSVSARENVFYIGGPFREGYTNFHKQAL